MVSFLPFTAIHVIFWFYWTLRVVLVGNIGYKDAITTVLLALDLQLCWFANIYSVRFNLRVTHLIEQVILKNKKKFELVM